MQLKKRETSASLTVRVLAQSPFDKKGKWLINVMRERDCSTRELPGLHGHNGRCGRANGRQVYRQVQVPPTEGGDVAAPGQASRRLLADVIIAGRCAGGDGMGDGERFCEPAGEPSEPYRSGADLHVTARGCEDCGGTCAKMASLRVLCFTLLPSSEISDEAWLAGFEDLVAV